MQGGGGSWRQRGPWWMGRISLPLKVRGTALGLRPGPE